MHPYGGVIGAGRRAGKRLAWKGILIPILSLHPSQPGSSRDPLLSPERVRSPTSFANNEPMKEVKPDWSKWVANPHLNYLGRWLADVDLGEPLSDEEKAQGRFRIGWSSEEERAKVNAYEDEEAGEIDGLLRTHEWKPPHR